MVVHVGKEEKKKRQRRVEIEQRGERIGPLDGEAIDSL